MNEAPLKDDLSVLPNTEARDEGKKSKTDPELWHALTENDRMDTEKTAWPEDLQVANRTDKKQTLTTN